MYEKTYVLCCIIDSQYDNNDLPDYYFTAEIIAAIAETIDVHKVKTNKICSNLTVFFLVRQACSAVIPSGEM